MQVSFFFILGPDDDLTPLAVKAEMWLLDTTSFKLVYFINPPERYAILSHTWGDGEVTFRDMENLAAARSMVGWTKIKGTCQRGKADGFSLVWIDSCCIDKSSSAELSESINSSTMPHVPRLGRSGQQPITSTAKH